MKMTSSKLRSIISEEIRRVLSEQQRYPREPTSHRSEMSLSDTKRGASRAARRAERQFGKRLADYELSMSTEEDIFGLDIDNPDLQGYSKLAIEVATEAVAQVGYPQGGMIENEIYQILAPMSGISDDDKWIITDEALSVAGIMLGVGPDAL